MQTNTTDALEEEDGVGVLVAEGEGDFVGTRDAEDDGVGLGLAVLLTVSVLPAAMHGLPATTVEVAEGVGVGVGVALLVTDGEEEAAAGSASPVPQPATAKTTAVRPATANPLWCRCCSGLPPFAEFGQDWIG